MVQIYFLKCVLALPGYPYPANRIRLYETGIDMTPASILEHMSYLAYEMVYTVAWNLPANLESTAVAIGLEKDSLYSSPKKGKAKECSN